MRFLASRNQVNKYYNAQASVQVLGTLMNNPKLFNRNEYQLDIEDFIGKKHCCLFSCIVNLLNQGLEIIKVADIENYLSKNDLAGHNLFFEKENDIEWINDVFNESNVNNFDYYYSLVRKLSLLRNYLVQGINITDLLDVDELDNNLLKIQQEKFDLMTIEDIKRYYDKKILNIKSKFCTREEGKSRKSGENAKELRERLRENPAFGLNLESEFLNTITRGALPKKFFLETRDSGCVDCDTEFFNGHEWKKISKFSENDKVLQYNEDGTTTLVTPLNYIKNKQDKLWHFETKYGLNQCLSDEHTVVYLDYKNRLKKIKFKELRNNNENTKMGFTGKFITTFGYNGEGIELTEFEIRLMCAVICDGTFSHSYSDKSLCKIHVKKQRKMERLEWILNKLNLQWKIFKHEDGTSHYVFKSPRIEKEFTSYWYNCNNEQFRVICDEILNWDGCQCNNRKRFSTTIKSTADFVQFAFATQGKRASINIHNRQGQFLKNSKYTFKCIEYEINITNRTKISMMRSSENKNIYKTNIEEYKTKDGYEYCFTVPSHMLVLRRENRIFITGNCGKSRNAIKRLINICSPYVWDFKNNKYIENPNKMGNSGLYIGTEMSLEDEIEPMIWAFISGIEQDRIMTNNLTKEEEERLDLAMQYSDEMQLFLEDEDDYDLVYLWNTIEKYKNDYNICAVAIDYLELTTALSGEYIQMTRGMTAREDQVLLNLSKEIKSMCKNFDLTIFGYTQTTDEARTMGYRDQRAVKGARSLPNKVDVGITVFEPTNKELELLESIIRKYQRGFNNKIIPNTCYTIYKNRGGRHKDVKIWGVNDLGTGRFIDMFVTDKYYNPIEIEKTIIEMKE